jgi:hypothetical protein
MKKNILAALVCTALVTAGCGGSSGGSSTTGGTTGTTTGGTTGTTTGGTTGTTTGGTTGTTTGGGTTGGTTGGGTTGGGTTGGDDRPRPAAGTVRTSSISGSPVVSNGATGNAEAGPVAISRTNDVSFPRLAVGDYWWVNNAFNSGNTGYSDWFQTITLPGGDGNITPTVDYDWGAEGDLNNQFATVSFPELIFGAKSEFEVSAPFDQIGLPIENTKLPNQINIAYDYSFTQAASGSNTADSNVDGSGYNIAIESFWHESCDIERTGNNATDNQVFEMMVWLHLGKRGPVAEGRNGAVGTFTDSNGRVYDVFSKTDAFFRGETGVRNYLAFVAQVEQTSGTIPYHEFINEVRTNTAAYGTGWRNLQDSDCLANILLGTEIWYGAGSFRWNDISIQQVY